MRQISLNDKLVVYFVLLGIAGVIIVQSLSYYLSRQALLDRTFEQLTLVRYVKTSQIKACLDDRKNDSEMLAGSEIFKDILNTNLFDPNFQNPDSSHFKIKSYYLVSYLASTGHYKNLIFFKPRSHALKISLADKESTNEFSILSQEEFYNYTEIFSNPQKPSETTIHDIMQTGKMESPSLFITTPLSGNEDGSLIVLEVSIDEINRIMLNNSPDNGFGTSGESYIVGDDLLMRSLSRFRPNSILATVANTRAVQNAFSGNTGISIIDDYRGIKVLSAYAPFQMNDINWVILAEIDFSEVMAPVYNLRNNTILTSVAIAVLIFIFAFILARQITSPILTMNKAASKIGEGNLDVQLQVKSNDEIGELTATFNKMAHQLLQQKELISLERKKRLTSLYDGQEQERQRLSRELHDGLGQSFIAIKLQLENFCDNLDEQKAVRLEKIKTYFEQTLEEIRRMSNDLAPSTLQEFGLVTALRNLCQTFSEQSNKNISFSSEGSSPLMSKKVRNYLYRISQEALSNAIKHSGADKIEVDLRFDDRKIFLEFQDNGCGFDVDKTKSCHGNGINNMHERINLINGFIQIISLPNKGTRIRIECKG